MKPALVVLAAGASTRLGECKALVDLGGRSALEHILAASAALVHPPPLVVSGRHHELIAEHCRALECDVSLNSDWSHGRETSVAHGLDARTGHDVIIAAVDCPLVPREVYAALATAWEQHGRPERGWLAPFIESDSRKQFGHPIVMGRELAAHALRQPELSLREVRSAATPLLALATSRREILDDLDQPADLARLRERLAQSDS